MHDYIAFLRSINVGGHSLKMEQLRAIFAELGFSSVRTFIQSGNVFFATDLADRRSLESKIEAQLAAKLGFAVPVFVRPVPVLQKCVQTAPFRGEIAASGSRQLVMFLSKALTKEITWPHSSPNGEFEVIAVVQDIAFVRLHLRNGRSGNVTGYIEKEFGVRTTGRFYHTLQKMLAEQPPVES